MIERFPWIRWQRRCRANARDHGNGELHHWTHRLSARSAGTSSSRTRRRVERHHLAVVRTPMTLERLAFGGRTPISRDRNPYAGYWVLVAPPCRGLGGSRSPLEQPRNHPFREGTELDGVVRVCEHS